MARRRFSRVPRGAVQRRRRTWARNFVEGNAPSVGPAVAFDLLGPWAAQVGATLPGLTVGPVIGNVSLKTDGTIAEITMGLIVANREAIAGDITAFDPIGMADRTLDWMLVVSRRLRTGDETLHIDVRTDTSRKIPRVGDTLFVVVRATTAVVNFDGLFNTLVLLP